MFTVHRFSRRRLSGLVVVLLGATLATTAAFFGFDRQTAAMAHDAGLTASDRDHGQPSPGVGQNQRSSPEALLRTESTLRTGDVRHSDVGLALVARGGWHVGQSFLRLRCIGCRHFACAQPRLEILFCTWQT
ncbi:MAG: hypothetical protein ABFC77_11395 [Thermoguttaceae bacterium]